MSVHHFAYVCISGLRKDQTDLVYKGKVSLTYGFTARDLFAAIGNPLGIHGLSEYYRSYKAQDIADRFIASDGVPALLEYHKDQFCISINIVSIDAAESALTDIVTRNSPRQYFEFCEYSDKILLQPSHCVIAVRKDAHSKWICDPDTSIDMDLKVAVFRRLVSLPSVEWESGKNLAIELNKLISV